MSWIERMAYSIVHQDVYILFFLLLAVIDLVILLQLNKTTASRVKEWRSGVKNTSFARYKWEIHETVYSVFVTFISLFPLLGMFGTVKELMKVDLGDGNFAGISGNFFGALTSTAWGIIFAIVFKIIHALIEGRTEGILQECKEQSEICSGNNGENK